MVPAVRQAAAFFRTARRMPVRSLREGWWSRTANQTPAMFLTNLIIRVVVTSSNLRAVGYDSWSQTLEIEFRSGGAYAYYGVPPWVHGELMMASSHGRYFHSHILGKYEYRRLPS